MVGKGAYRFLQRGRGHFIAAIQGDYELHFESSGLGKASGITINYTVYPAHCLKIGLKLAAYTRDVYVNPTQTSERTMVSPVCPGKSSTRTD